jgi:Tol biopolymer transport system component
VFISNADGRFRIYSKSADGTGDVTPLSVDDVDEYLPSYSPDGKYLVMERRSRGEQAMGSIWALPLFGDRKLIAIARGQFDYARPSLSPDGKWLAYQSSEAGHPDVFIVSFPQGKGKWQVSTNGGFWPRWNPNGKEVFYVSPDYKLMAADIVERATSLDIGSAHELYQASPAYVSTSFYDVAPDGKKFVIVSRNALQSSQPLTLVTSWPALLKK